MARKGALDELMRERIRAAIETIVDTRRAKILTGAQARAARIRAAGRMRQLIDDWLL